MKTLQILLGLFFLMRCAPPVWAQSDRSPGRPGIAEICDNQLDDDGDGYVDCYDSDCQCFNGVDCSVDAVSTTFMTRLAWQSTEDRVSVVATPIVANLNPQEDDMPEIIVAQAGPDASFPPNTLLFYKGDGSNSNDPRALTVFGTMDDYPPPAPTVGDIDRDGIPELVVACNDRRIRIYTGYNETLFPPMTLWLESPAWLDEVDQKPYLADFDQDGIPEIYAGSDIFTFDLSNPLNPQLLNPIQGPAFKGQAIYDDASEGTCNPVAADLLTIADCNGDPDCAGLELAAGPVIYSIDLDPNDGDGYEIKMQRDLNQMAPGNDFTDGFTAVADVDLDGMLEVVVATRRMNNEMGVVVWNKDQLVRFMPFPTNDLRSGGVPCIANVYNDKLDGFNDDFPEIIVTSAYHITCFNLNLAGLVPTIPWWWALPTVDFSGFTGATTFDFNGDGLLEIVLRDERFLRILYGGNQPFPPGVDINRDWFRTVCGSITADEYPIVADVDNDGQAEIAVTGYTFPGYNTPQTDYRGRLQVYESDAEPWMPCRDIWNQFGYFIVNVNDDLSIPEVQQLHHLEFPAPGSGNRPLNRYLSQRPALDENFVDYLPVPDADVTFVQANCNGDSLHIEITLCNPGSRTLPSGIPVAFYSDNPTTTNAFLIAVAQIPIEVGIDSCKTITLGIPQANGVLFGIVNDDGTLPTPFQPALQFPVTAQPECDWANNLFQFTIDDTQAPPINLGADIALCQDSIITLNAGGGHAGYLWQDGSTDSLLVVQAPGVYWVEVTDYCLGKRVDSLLVEFLGIPEIQIDTVQGDCSGNPSSANATASGNHPPFQFLWSTGSTSSQISGLPDGAYFLTVTDARGCAAYDTALLQSSAPLQAALAAETILCAGGSASVTINIGSGTGPYQYAWSNGATGLSEQTLPAGEHFVTLTDASGCSGIFSILLQEPLPLLSAGITASASCPDAPTGALSYAGGQQGTPPYTLLWSTGDILPNLTQLPPGAYGLTLTDANGCTRVDSALINLHDAPALSTQLMHVRCFGNQDGAIQINPAGGGLPYTYQWSGGQQTANLIDLPSGFFLVTVTDANGCTLAQTFEITEPEILHLQAVLAADTCTTGTGAISATATGGTPPYNYLWSTGETVPAISNLSAGNYTLTLSDASGCSTVQSYLIPDAGAHPDLQTFSDTITCVQPVASIGVTGNLTGLHFSWSGPTGPLGDLPIQTVDRAGSYQVTATDASGCSTILPVELLENTTLPQAEAGADQTVLPCPPGMVHLDATGSNSGPGYENTWMLILNNSVVAEMQDLIWSTNLPGLYVHRVTDRLNGCESTDSIFITETPPILAEIFVDSISCAGRSDGGIELNVVSGGNPPFSYSFDGSAYGPNNTFIGLPPGAYMPSVKDASGCQWDTVLVLPDPEPFSVLLEASDTTLELGQTLTLQAFPSPANALLMDISWEPADVFDFLPMSLWQWLQPDTDTEFSVRILNSNGCPAEDRIQIRVDKFQVYAPNAIRPGDGGLNGWFTLFTSDAIGQVRLLRIYDRWGSLVYEQRDFPPGDPARAWDGTIDGETASPGVYAWYAEIELPDGRIRKVNGDVTVVR